MLPQITTNNNNKMKEEEIKIRINDEEKQKFKVICESEGITMSNKLQIFIINEINSKKTIEDKITELVKYTLDITNKGTGSFNVISSSSIVLDKDKIVDVDTVGTRRFFTCTYRMSLIDFIEKYKDKKIYFYLMGSDMILNKIRAIVI